MKAVVTFCTLLVAICAPAQAIRWERISPNTTWWPIADVAAGNGVVVAVAAYEVIASKDDGLTWKLVLSSDKQLVSIKFGNGMFLLLGQGVSYTSIDGINWARYSGGGGGSIIFGNGLFVVGNASGQVNWTSDGVSWDGTHVQSAGDLYQGAYGNGIFMFKEPYLPNPMFPQLQYPRFVTKSTDGTNWARFEMNFPNSDQNFSGLAFVNGKFLAHSGGMFGAQGYISSTDGVNWTVFANEAGIPGSGLFYEGGQFFQLKWYDSSRRTAAQVWTSPDLITWKHQDIPYAPDFSEGPNSVTFSGSKYIVVGNKGMVLRGDKPDVLERIDSLHKDVSFLSVTAVSNIVVGVGDMAVSVSTNGGGTFQKGMAFPPNLTAVAYGDGKFVAVGDGLAIVTSANAFDWFQLQGNGQYALRKVIYSNGLWVAVGDGGVILTSTTAEAFNGRLTGDHNNLAGVAYGAGVWVAVGSNGTVATSVDGQNWTTGNVGSSTNLTGIAFGNGVFVAVSAGSGIYTSANGVDWTTGEIAGMVSAAGVAFAHGVFVTGDSGTRNSYESADGKTWAKSELPGDARITGLDAANGRIWISGPYLQIYNDELPPIVLIGSSTAAGKFTLTFNAPADGIYKVFSATDVAALNWDLAASLTVNAGNVSWTDQAAPQTTKFYYVQQQ